MKIPYRCGATIHDAGDAMPTKGHIVPDRLWFGLLDAVDAAIETTGPTKHDKETACIRVREMLTDISRRAWQCAACGTVYIEDRARRLQVLLPESDAAKDLFHN